MREWMRWNYLSNLLTIEEIYFLFNAKPHREVNCRGDASGMGRHSDIRYSGKTGFLVFMVMPQAVVMTLLFHLLLEPGRSGDGINWSGYI
jgi:hypothetical protein